MSDSFLIYSRDSGHLADVEEGELSSALSVWSDNELSLNGEATHFGFVLQGSAELEVPQGRFCLQSGMYFAIPGHGSIRGGQGAVFSRNGYHGLFQIGGPVESRGRLRYINGCSDSLLIAPVLRGDPCLNLLHIPPGVNQTAHTHPSHRLGIVAQGRGACRAGGMIDLSPGMVWQIPAGGLHSFHTTDSEMVIIAYHPDSDCGPTDAAHPMLNRTLVNGISVASEHLGEKT